MFATAGAARLAGAAAMVSGCGQVGFVAPETVEVAELTVTSPAFVDAEALPARYACPAYGGLGRTPPLRWSGVLPGSTVAFAIVVDSPDASAGAYVSWVIVNIDGHTRELVEGARPVAAVEALNTSDTTAYVAPCPSEGERNRYRFTVYALGERVQVRQREPLKEALAVIAEHTVGRGRITATFGQAS
ncbi:YbhB/YbcL family Raf kinase inhibitor-like protein [Actinomadura sp. 3N407]|uniref:YbhB/YbcL family Raf kinase inhibitor-like protein n=1 Tax=Actinomadura sp. 3N407 TaxID=3457423 RepID=UPI003FCEE46B